MVRLWCRRRGDLIDLVRKLYRLGTVSDALNHLDDFEGLAATKPFVRPANNDNAEPDAPAFTLIDEKPLTSKALIAYLDERGIPAGVASSLVREVHYRHGDKNYFALGLPNESGGFEIRNPYFKGTIGNKDISIVPGPTGRVFVFEGMFDFLTAVARFGGKLDGTALILNSVALKEKAVDWLRQHEPTVIELYRDNDRSGEELAAYFSENLSQPTIVDWSTLYQGHNDLNAWHVNQQRGAVRR
ncbi:MAG: toprim domain-containing protein [Pirellulaceae bacterium]